MSSLSIKDVFSSALQTATDDFTRKLIFMGLLGKELQAAGVSLPVIVGGMALEFFTFGKYTSDDIDIKSDQGKTFALLTRLGFERQGEHLWFSESMGIIIDWRGAALDEGPEAQRRVLCVNTEFGSIALAPLEDILVDRLCAAKFWGHKDSLHWAKYMYTSVSALPNALDMSYLQTRLEVADVRDIFETEITSLLSS